MNSIKYLIAAYIATWLIHGVYISSLVRRYAKLHKEMKEVGKAGFRG